MIGSLYLYVFLNFVAACFLFLFFSNHTFNKIESLKSMFLNTQNKILTNLLLLNLLGTPITLGFFYKILVFNFLLEKNFFLILFGILLNLIMLILYLSFLKKISTQFKRIKTTYNVFNESREHKYFAATLMLIFITFYPVFFIYFFEIILICF